MNFEKIIDGILEREAGFTDHEADRGGPTNHGITQAVARKNGYDGPMEDMPEHIARAIYFKRYITEPQFDKVTQINERIGMELIDTGVNMGQSRASEFFQRALNVFNMQGSRYADLHVDGRIGSVTLDALKAFLRWRGKAGEDALYKALNSLQGVRYIEIAERNPTQESFILGWFSHRVD